MSQHLKPIENPKGGKIYYQGPDLELGPMPAVIFFALSAKASLFQDPFNQLITFLANERIRIFSWDLPFHEDGADPKEAMYKWASEFQHNPHFIAEFIQKCHSHLDYLISCDIIALQHIAVAGISRGAFIGTHFAAKDSRIQTILGFAPLTHPRPLEEFDHLSFEDVALLNVVDSLVHRNLRFYIGNDDQRVGTHDCFTFIQALTKASIQKGIRSPPVEMTIYPSIGHKGHGTPPHIFIDGAQWLKNQLLK